jgi:hypothetical protein
MIGEKGLSRGPQAVGSIVRRLLKGAHITAITVTGDFALEFTRDRSNEDGDVPLVVSLTLRSEWWIGDRDVWEQSLQTSVPLCGEPRIEPHAVRAHALTWLYRSGAEVADISLSEDGTLIISTSVAELIVPGQEDVFEESWILDVPQGVPNHDRWSAVCTSTGELFGRQP